MKVSRENLLRICSIVLTLFSLIGIFNNYSYINEILDERTRAFEITNNGYIDPFNVQEVPKEFEAYITVGYFKVLTLKLIELNFYFFGVLAGFILFNMPIKDPNKIIIGETEG